MDCHEITQIPVTLEILQRQGDGRLHNLLKCIYSLYQADFLKWIMGRYENSRFRDKLLADAKDAFQMGIHKFHQKAQKEDFNIKGSLKTTIYSFGLLQLLAYFKTDRLQYGSSEFMNGIEVFFQDELFEKERENSLNAREHILNEALLQLPESQRTIMYLKFFLELRSEQIAEKMGISVGHVYNQSAKAYRSLRQILETKFSDKWN